jgi:hypothetical protein
MADDPLTDQGCMMKSSNSLKGTWKIVWMEQWDQDYVDMVVPGHITFEAEGRGHFQFGCVEGSFNWSDADSYFDSRWEGCDEMDEARGEIYAEIENGELRGTVEFDNGDEFGFRAVKKSVSLKRANASINRLSHVEAPVTPRF